MWQTRSGRIVFSRFYFWVALATNNDKHQQQHCAQCNIIFVDGQLLPNGDVCPHVVQQRDDLRNKRSASEKATKTYVNRAKKDANNKQSASSKRNRQTVFPVQKSRAKLRKSFIEAKLIYNSLTNVIDVVPIKSNSTPQSPPLPLQQQQPSQKKVKIEVQERTIRRQKKVAEIHRNNVWRR
mgnify:CR=1 FL=1